MINPRFRSIYEAESKADMEPPRPPYVYFFDVHAF